ncbi:thioesterase II family protein [Micromonospora sp. CA-263727]|uniref:thioesterase II family protein n=1 Tax=Micromonospora sp. CA-263727 TaxID=3239967 RepID=UPI003D904AFE
MSEQWFWARRPRPAAATRLVCLPYAGGAAAVYRAWGQLAPSHVEVCPVELPGRGVRMGEEPYRRLTPLVRALADALEPLLDRPYALFGHSMGGLLAFELARLLRRRGRPGPSHLFVSAAPAPDRRHEPTVHDASDAEVKAHLRALNGTPPEVLENEELMALALPIIRADFAVLETYEFIDEPPLDTPLTVFGGTADRTVRPAELAGWRDHATTVDLRMLPGDHFFIDELAPELIRLITARVTPARYPGW